MWYPYHMEDNITTERRRTIVDRLFDQALGFILGAFVVAITTQYYWAEDAIKHGAGYRNVKSGAFQWHSTTNR